MAEEVLRLAFRQYEQIDRRQKAYSACFNRWDRASQLLTKARAGWMKFQESLSESLGGVVSGNISLQSVQVTPKENGAEISRPTSMAEAQGNIAAAKIALNEADEALKRLQVREERRKRRMVRRENAGRLKTAKIPVRGSPLRVRAVSGSASGSAEASEAQDQSQLRGMSLLDKIIAAVFASIPLGQKVPFEFIQLIRKVSRG